MHPTLTLQFPYGVSGDLLQSKAGEETDGGLQNLPRLKFVIFWGNSSIKSVFEKKIKWENKQT